MNQISNHQKLHIPKPCPYVPKKKDLCTDGFHCQSCNKVVIDFTDKTIDEIKASLTPTTCGIFTSEQLTNQQQMPFYRRVLFYSLMLFSFVGISVQPLSAQNNKQELKTKKVEIKAKKLDKKEDKLAKNNIKKTRKRRRLFRRRGRHIKGKMRTMGCPDF